MGDADKLSRVGLLGLRSIIEANSDYQVPFYQKGGEIVRSKNAPMIALDGIKTCVDDINSCTGWEKMMETKAGRVLMPLLGRTNHQFLQVFAQYSGIVDYGVWMGWLNSVLATQEKGRQDAVEDLVKGKIWSYLVKTITLEDPKLLSEKSFQSYSTLYPQRGRP